MQGTYTLTLNSIVCDDMSPSSEDTAQIATNIVATSYLALKGSEAEFRVGANHVLRLDANTLQKADEGVRLVKTGAGTVLHGGAAWNPTNTFWVKEGTYVRSGKSYPEFRSDIVVGGAGKDAVLTGKKLEQKYYRTHSGFPGGLKETQYKTLMEKRPELAMRLAVRGMLQKNTIAQWQLKRLRIFAGAEHDHAAQKPEVWDR